MHRRYFLKTLTTCASFVLACASGILKPIIAFAEWNTEAFSAITEKDAIELFFPDQNISTSDAIDIGAYDLVENGAVVPVKIKTDLPEIKTITILVEHNPNPLIANFNLSPGCEGFVATRIKMDQSSDIIAVVNSGGKLYSTRKFVEVLAGGCG